jgi:hypothetical protein
LVAFPDGHESRALDAAHVRPHDGFASQALHATAANALWARIIALYRASIRRPCRDVTIINIFGRAIRTLLHHLVPNYGWTANILVEYVLDPFPEHGHRLLVLCIQHSFFLFFLGQFLLVCIFRCRSLG